MGSLALATALLSMSLAGPPKLPPLPGESAPSEPDPEPEKPRPAPPDPEPAPKPAPKPKPQADAPAEPPGEPSPSPQDDGGWSTPDVAEPPQPDSTGPAPEPAAESSEQGRPPRPDRSDGPGAAPTADDAGRIPGDPQSDAGVPRLPPPERPPYNGLGLFIASGATFGVALTEQIVAHVLFKRRCLDPIQRGELHIDDTEEADQFGDVARKCAPGVLPALALRVHSDLGLLMSIGLAAGGAAMRANQQGYDDVFGNKSRRKTMALRMAGISLLGVGAVTWLSTGAGSWGWQGSCGDARCVGRARVFGFVMRDVSAAMIASGAGMLTWAEVYRKRHTDFTRERAISVSPAVSRTQIGLSASGRF